MSTHLQQVTFPATNIHSLISKSWVLLASQPKTTQQHINNYFIQYTHASVKRQHTCMYLWGGLHESDQEHTVWIGHLWVGILFSTQWCGILHQNSFTYSITMLLQSRSGHAERKMRGWVGCDLGIFLYLSNLHHNNCTVSQKDSTSKL